MQEICPDDRIVKNVVSGGVRRCRGFRLSASDGAVWFSGIKGRIHSSEFEITDEENVYLHTAKIVMKTVYDMLSCPQLQIKNKDFSERKEFYLKNWLYKEQE